jgi:hypothetical protein
MWGVLGCLDVLVKDGHNHRVLPSGVRRYPRPGFNGNAFDLRHCLLELMVKHVIVEMGVDLRRSKVLVPGSGAWQAIRP